jgi:hypothetical protein
VACDQGEDTRLMGATQISYNSSLVVFIALAISVPNAYLLLPESNHGSSHRTSSTAHFRIDDHGKYTEHQHVVCEL